VIIVGSIVNRYIERVVIDGAISRPGYYGWEEDMPLALLIKRAGGLKENALLTRGLIYRASRDHSKAYERFIPQEIVDGTSELTLKDGDSVVIGDKSQLFPDETVRVVGEVQMPGPLVFGDGMTAMDAILLSGGMLKSAEFNRIEIARRVDGTGEMEIAKVLEATTNAALMVLADEVPLQGLDVIMVRPNPAYYEQRIVSMEGEITYPGPYVLLKRKERLSDLIGRSGGLTSMADANAAFIIRETRNPFFMKVKMKMEAEQLSDDMDELNRLELDRDSILLDTISFDIRAVLSKKGSKYDIHLVEGDIVHIPMQKNTITVRGEVNNTVMVNYSGRKLKPYLRDAGGTSRFADKKRVYVVDPSGRASSTKQFMGIRSYPNVAPGSIVMVPPKMNKENGGPDPARVAALSSILASTTSLLFVIVTIMR
jgi:protein involved in polysaccharide export with SLBB domain